MKTFLAVIALAVLVWVLPIYWQKWRRSYLRARPLSPSQYRLVQSALPFYSALAPEAQRELCANLSLFLHDKEFVGCDGLRVTDEMRVCVAAWACLLLTGRQNRCYPALRTVLLYPDTYIARETHFEGAIEMTADSAREGESHYLGPVVLSWADIEEDLFHPEQGRNVIVHEFAHKLDEEDGVYDGRPLFTDSESGGSWAPVFREEFERLRDKVLTRQEGHGTKGGSTPAREAKASVLDPYGAQSPAEFFAVASESFFSIPVALRQHHAALYAELRAFYHLDPASWHDGSQQGNQYPR
ncbi:zinc-dependent peptidase [Microbulbifer sediminum]|uniref:M90 family metallopeptidase n=1 Tax=Microbulbifer sediminum TaxID=2904250 RepID=UPI001F466D22|nr:M90 family metallopeptidase [Microbulbifer sediminum]